MKNFNLLNWDFQNNCLSYSIICCLLLANSLFLSRQIFAQCAKICNSGAGHTYHNLTAYGYHAGTKVAGTFFGNDARENSLGSNSTFLGLLSGRYNITSRQNTFTGASNEKKQYGEPQYLLREVIGEIVK